MLQQLLQLLFPSLCVSCGYLQEALCSQCAEHLVLQAHRRQIKGLEVHCAFLYEPDSVLSTLIHAFKYEHRSNLARVFKPYLERTLFLFGLEGHALCPVPLFRGREHERGYNQAERLARVLGLPVFKGLARVRDTGSQTRLGSREERLLNVQGAFAVRGSVPKRVLLVDDVVTTGSTLLECREVLMKAGAKEVLALTLADREETRYTTNNENCLCS